MALELTPQPAVQAHNDHWNNDHGQNCVCSEDEQINWTEPRRIEEARWPSMQIIRDVGVVGDVANQKQS